MRTKKYLMIGGPLDGKRRSVTQLIARTPVQVFSRQPIPAGATDIPVTFDTYHMVRCGKEEVYVHSSVKDVMAALVKGYHYYRKPRYDYGPVARPPALPRDIG